MFTEKEIEMLHDALNMALASNKRMQSSKPQFVQIFRTIETDITALKTKLNNIVSQTPAKTK